jgi:hypothetical protein
MRLVNKTRLASILVVVLAGCLAGCYTLLKHPTVAEAPAEADFGRCADCHDYPYHAGPYGSYYPDPWWIYYELPWWYEHAVVSGGDSLSAPGYRGIIERNPVKRPIDGGGIGVSTPTGTVPRGVLGRYPIAATDSSTGGGTLIKKKIGGDSDGDKRGIEERSATKRENDANRSGDTKDASKTSDETKDSKERKKEQP